MNVQQAKDFLLFLLRKHEEEGKLMRIRATKKGIVMSVNTGENWKSLLVSDEEIQRIVGDITNAS